MALTLSTIFFIVSNLSVVPFYLLMMAAPHAGFTRRVLGSLWPIALPALVQVMFIILIVILTRPNVLDLWRALYVENGPFSSTTVEFLSRMYGAFPEFATLHGWVHIVVDDMFMARQAYLDGVGRTIPAWLIAVMAMLIGFFGPMGVIIYLLLRMCYVRAGMAA